MKRFITHLALCSLLFLGNSSLAQIPTPQDCLGAIPICQNIFSTSNSYLGQGNYPGELGPGSCLTGEINSTWLTFTVQVSGLLNFVITPVVSTDYDWAVYNLTNANCSNILTNGSLLVSCNAAAPFGPTGTSAASSQTWGPPGGNNAFNAPIPVTAGQTYVINISNWFGTAGGFSINFGASTAVIFDNIAPVLQSVNAASCNTSSLTFNFSENVLCNTVQAADFTVTGPGGPYTVTSVTGAACAAGGTMENTYTITVTPALSQGGSYNLNLVGGSGFVTDLCGNVAAATSIAFNVNGVNATIASTINPTCSNSNGSITAGANGGTVPYNYSINGGTLQSSPVFGNLNANTYLITVQDATGCTDTIHVTLTSGNGSVSTIISNLQQISCYGLCDGSATVSVVGGNAPYNYLWTSGSVTATASGLCPGNDTVLVSDASGCYDTSIVTITQPAAITGVINKTDALCNGASSGTAAVVAAGGTGTYTYSWSPSGGNASSASNLHAGNYTVMVTDQNNCSQSFPVTIGEPALLVLDPSTPVDMCIGAGTILNAFANGGTAPYNYSWNNGAGSGSVYNVNPGTNTSYTCVATDANNCTSAPVTFSVTVLPMPEVELGDDIVICEGVPLKLDAYNPKNSDYLWSTGSTGNNIDVNATGIYSVEVSNFCGSVSDFTTVIFHDCNVCVHYPNTFTPNLDGLNDFFRAVATCSFNSFHLYIYNRWGQLIYDSNDPTDGWDGTFNGAKCESGTYVYMATYSGTGPLGNEINDVAKGNVTLLR